MSPARKLALLTALATLALVPGAIQAQVAAPSLNPVPSLALMPIAGTFAQTFVPPPSNPAILSRDTGSRAAAAYGQAEVTDLPGISVNPAYEGKAAGLLLAYVGKSLAAAAQSNTTTTNAQPGAGSNTYTTSVRRVGLAVPVGQRISLGIGRDAVRNTSTLMPSELEQTLLLAGATLRLGDILLFGVAGGSETIRAGLIPDQVKRSARQYGVALYWRGKEKGVHLELYRADLPERLFPGLTASIDANHVQGVTAELLLQPILLGFARQTDDTKDFTGSPANKDSLTAYTLGYRLSARLTGVLSRYEGRSANAQLGTNNMETNGTTLGLAYAF